MLITRYFKITTDNGNEYYFCKCMKDNNKIKEDELFKMAVNSTEFPPEELDYIDSVEEINFDEFSENYKLL